MEDKYRQVMRRCRNVLASNIVPCQHLYSLLLEQGVLGRAMLDDVQCCASREAKIGKILDLLHLTSEKNFERFLTVLQLSGHNIIAEFLREEANTSEARSNVADYQKEVAEKLPSVHRYLPAQEKRLLSTFIRDKLQGERIRSGWKAAPEAKSAQVVARQDYNEHLRDCKVDKGKAQEEMTTVKFRLYEADATSSGQEKEIKRLRDKIQEMEDKYRREALVASNFNAANNSSAIRLQEKLGDKDKEIKVAQMAIRKYMGLDPWGEEELSGDETPERLQKSHLHRQIHALFRHIDVIRGDTKGAEEKTLELRNRILEELGLPNYGQDPVVSVRQMIKVQEEELARCCKELEKMNGVIGSLVLMAQGDKPPSNPEPPQQAPQTRGRPLSAPPKRGSGRGTSPGKRGTKKRAKSAGRKKVEPDELTKHFIEANTKLDNLRQALSSRDAILKRLRRENLIMKKKVKQGQEELINMRKLLLKKRQKDGDLGPQESVRASDGRALDLIEFKEQTLADHRAGKLDLSSANGLSTSGRKLAAADQDFQFSDSDSESETDEQWEPEARISRAGGEQGSGTSLKMTLHLTPGGKTAPQAQVSANPAPPVRKSNYRVSGSTERLTASSDHLESRVNGSRATNHTSEKPANRPKTWVSPREPQTNGHGQATRPTYAAASNGSVSNHSNRVTSPPPPVSNNPRRLQIYKLVPSDSQPQASQSTESLNQAKHGRTMSADSPMVLSRPSSASSMTGSRYPNAQYLQKRRTSHDQGPQRPVSASNSQSASSSSIVGVSPRGKFGENRLRTSVVTIEFDEAEQDVRLIPYVS